MGDSNSNKIYLSHLKWCQFLLKTVVSVEVSGRLRLSEGQGKKNIKSS